MALLSLLSPQVFYTVNRPCTSMAKKTKKKVQSTKKPKTSTTSLLKQVLARLQPGPEAEKPAKKLVSLLEKQLKKNKIKAKVILGGSLAKETNLKEDHDIDVFVAFDYFYKFKDISKLLGQILKSIKPGLKTKRVHGSRDYFHITLPGQDYQFEIVPVLDIYDPKDAVNITDCSPLHVSWVAKQVKKRKKLANEIRLTKAFCKSAGVYGAESYIRGFSGHVVDILTIHYGGFIELLKASQKWKDKTIIDYTNAHKGRALYEMNKSKLISPLIVVDPIHKERNAAAALDTPKFERFKAKAKQFLKKPHADFFVKHELTLDEIKEKAGKNRLVLVDVRSKKGKEDVVGAKLLKSFEYNKRKLIENDFILHDAGWLWNKKEQAQFFFILENKKLYPTKKITGPRSVFKDHVKQFTKKHKKTFKKGATYYAEIKRKHVLPETLVKATLLEGYVQEKITSASVKVV